MLNFNGGLIIPKKPVDKRQHIHIIIPMAKNTTIRVCVKCSDMFNAQLIEDGKESKEYDGYVPLWFPNPNENHYGDYVDLEIDLETGQILNWKKPTKELLEETFP